MFFFLNNIFKFKKKVFFSFKQTVSEFNECKPRLKSPKNWFKLSAGLNLEKRFEPLPQTQIF